MLCRSLLPQRCLFKQISGRTVYAMDSTTMRLNMYENLIQLGDIMPNLSTDVGERLAARAESSMAFP
jgi:hypothetical protein